MVSRFSLWALSLTVATASVGAMGADPAWNYDVASGTGPLAWGRLHHSWGVCAGGSHQSPIDIVSTTKNSALPRLQFDYDDQPIRLLNNGHYLVWDFPHGLTKLGDKDYSVSGVTFHAPSEHRIRGVAFPMEAQIWHKSAEGENDLVVSILFVNGPPNRTLRKFWNTMPRHSGGTRDLGKHTASLSGILPLDRNYFYYSGSQSKPPCKENVKYIVFRSQVPIGEEQVEVFHELFGKTNARPTQPLKRRRVQESVGLARRSAEAAEEEEQEEEKKKNKGVSSNGSGGASAAKSAGQKQKPAHIMAEEKPAPPPTPSSTKSSSSSSASSSDSSSSVGAAAAPAADANKSASGSASGASSSSSNGAASGSEKAAKPKQHHKHSKKAKKSTAAKESTGKAAEKAPIAK